MNIDKGDTDDENNDDNDEDEYHVMKNNYTSWGRWHLFIIHFTPMEVDCGNADKGETTKPKVQSRFSWKVASPVVVSCVIRSHTSVLLLTFHLHLLTS